MSGYGFPAQLEGAAKSLARIADALEQIAASLASIDDEGLAVFVHKAPED